MNIKNLVEVQLLIQPLLVLEKTRNHQENSGETDLNIILGSGFYLEPTHPDYVKKMNEDDISQLIQEEYFEGIDVSNVKIGIVGEIGVSKDFTSEKENLCRRF